MTTEAAAAVSFTIDVQQTPSQSEAQQVAASELADPKYHNQPAQGSVTSMPTVGAPTTAPPTTPPPAANPTKGSGGTVILVILGAVALVLILVFVLRMLGKPRKDDKDKAKKKRKKPTGDGAAQAPAFDEVLYGAALHRRTAQRAADAGQWAEAIRERFRAVIRTLDELGLLPERPERTAGEAARDAGEVLPEHRAALAAAATAFNEVEYGEYVGTPDGYAQIRAVDEQIAALSAPGRPGSRR